MHDLAGADTTLLRLIGATGASARSIEGDPAFDRSRIDALVERGYVWVACPDNGPVYVVSDLGTLALRASATPSFRRSPQHVPTRTWPARPRSTGLQHLYRRSPAPGV
jgi:hypothetical protein